ncbi:MAG: sulfur carrier protein ThiS [Anaerolineae bacterium]|nr:sulfur carrier protein ThiS [Anaerolineae bacterium]
MIRVNNRDEVDWREGLTVSVLLDRLGYTYPHIVVTVDGQVVYEEEYDRRVIPDGANVRLIHLIAGG